MSPLVAAVALGVVLANVGLLPARCRPGARFAARRLLRAGIVLLGFRIAVGDVLRLGSRGLAVVVAVVALTFAGTLLVGRRLRLGSGLAILVATGYAICGVSAIAAMEGVADAEEEEVTWAIALVTLAGSLSILVLPVLGGALGLVGEQFGSWVGASVHDVAQVVATASSQGPVALQAAVVVKLTRVVLLAPLVAGASLLRRRRLAAPAERGTDRTVAGAGGGGGGAAGKQLPLVPLFVAGFLAAIVVRSTGLLPDGWLGTLRTAESTLLTLALAGLGAGVDIQRLRRVPAKVLVLGVVSWVVVAGVAYLGVLAGA